MQHGINADVLPPTDNVGMSATDISVSAPVVTAPVLGESDGKLTSKKSPADDLSSELLPSFGWSSPSSSSPSPTLPWGTAKNSSPTFSPNRVRKGQSQTSPSEGSLMCHLCRRSNPIGKTDCPNPVGCCYRRYWI